MPRGIHRGRVARQVVRRDRVRASRRRRRTSARRRRGPRRRRGSPPHPELDEVRLGRVRRRTSAVRPAGGFRVEDARGPSPPGTLGPPTHGSGVRDRRSPDFLFLWRVARPAHTHGHPPEGSKRPRPGRRGMKRMGERVERLRGWRRGDKHRVGLCLLFLGGGGGPLPLLGDILMDLDPEGGVGGGEGCGEQGGAEEQWRWKKAGHRVLLRRSAIVPAETSWFVSLFEFTYLFVVCQRGLSICNVQVISVNHRELLPCT